MKNNFVGQGVDAALREKLKMKIMGGKMKNCIKNDDKGLNKAYFE